jgi:two-component system OmpR family sensor kinase
MSLRARVLLAVFMIAGMVVATAIVTTRIAEQRLVAQVDTRITTAAPFGPGFQSNRPNRGNDPSDAPRYEPFFIAAIAGDDISTLAVPNLTGDELPVPNLDLDDITPRIANEDSTPFTVGADGGLEYRAVVRIVRDDVALIIAAPLDEVAASVSDIRTVSWIIAAIVLAILALVAWWVLRLGVRPVVDMTRAAASIADDDLSRRVPVHAPHTEAGELGLTLNSMLERLETSFGERAATEARLRRFVGDASHELRTPVQTIRGYAELYRIGALTDTERLDDAMRRTESEAVRMAGLVDELLTLARFDQGREPQYDDVDLSKLAHDAAADVRAIQPQRSITVDGLDSLVIEADEPRLRQVLANIVGNALVHTPHTATIAIHLDDTDTGAVIEVRDSGPGMEADVADRAFERFFRADPARSRSAGGSGLGLAIAHAAISAHDGTITLDSSIADGTTVRVTLPKTRPAPGPDS